MFEKSKLKKKIEECRSEIESIEKQRYRSQAALVAAIMNGEDADDTDVEYFNQYTDKIDRVRDQMHEYQRLLDSMEK